MNNVIKFPKQATPQPAPPVSRSAPKAAPSPKKPKTGSFINGVSKAIWIVTVLLWPILKWILALDCVFQFVRMVYHWDTPGMHAGWTFLLHYAVLCVLTYYVSFHQPKGL